jgi:predicted RNA-binding protein YlqC (UPF0109 family)
MHENLVSFTENLVKSLVSDPELVKVQEFLGDEGIIQLEIMVPEDEMGAVIGRGGKMAKALRVLIQAAAYNMNIKRVSINIDSF